MRKVIIILIFLGVSIMGKAQEFKLQHTNGKIIANRMDHVTISGYDGSEVIIKATIDRDDEDRERAKGLKLVNSLGLDDNTDLGLSVKEKDGNVIVTQIGDCKCHDNEGYKILIPNSMGVEFNHNALGSKILLIKDVSKEIVVSALYTNVDLENVTGPMSIKTVYGDVEARFSKVSQESSISLNSVYGLIDIAVPSNTKADIQMASPYGQFYTDLNVKVKTEDLKKERSTDSVNGLMKEVSTTRINGAINGGGVNIILKSGYDNVYLRKS